jgi:hypothetical protein
MISFTGESVSSALSDPNSLEIWLRLEWLGTVFLPAAYLHFSDALLETTGRPSRGRRRAAVRFTYLVSAGFAALLPGRLFFWNEPRFRDCSRLTTRSWCCWPCL